MNIIWNAVAGAASGLIGAMGLGGGGVLILYLVLILNMSQIKAQGINLLFFIPIAVLSLIIHCKNHLVEWKKAIPMILTGLIGVAAGTLVLDQIDPSILRKLFGAFIFIIGVKELWSVKKKAAGSEKPPPRKRKN